jgi:hypothetical protein
VRAAWFVLLALPAFGAVTGTVINQSTGKPQAGATVGFNKLGGNGIELIDQAKSDANGNFSINQTPTGGMPYLLRTVYDGVSYNHMLPPGTPTTGITVDVYHASKQQGDAKITKHMILFEPAGGQMTVNETYILENGGKVAWNDSDQGTLKFFLPEGAGGKAQVQATAGRQGAQRSGHGAADAGAYLWTGGRELRNYADGSGSGCARRGRGERGSGRFWRAGDRADHAPREYAGEDDFGNCIGNSGAGVRAVVPERRTAF